MAHIEPMHPPEEIVDAYVLDKLEGSALRAFEEQLFICPTCQRRVEGTDFILELLRAVPLDSRTEAVGTSASAQALHKAEKRTGLRAACSRLASICALAPATPAQPVLALLVNTSSSGVGMLARVPLREGSRVLVRTRTLRKEGRIQYCIRKGATFQMGVEFMPSSQEGG